MQMLQAVSNIAPRGVYVCGNATSTSGLTVIKPFGCFTCKFSNLGSTGGKSPLGGETDL